MDAITQQRMIQFTRKLYTCSDLYEIKKLIDEFNSLDNPYVYQASAQACLALDDYDGALPLFKKAITYGLKFPNQYWDTQLSDAIGSSISKILTLFKIGCTDKCTENLYVLGYCYLSNCIKKLGVNAFESYQERANLVNYTPQIIKNSNMPMGAFFEVYAISDYYFSAQGLKNNGFSSEAYDKINMAINLHDWLEDMTVAGKDADEYSLEEIVEIGKKRHDQLFKGLEKDLKNNKYSINSSQLNSIFDSIERKY